MGTVRLGDEVRRLRRAAQPGGEHPSGRIGEVLEDEGALSALRGAEVLPGSGDELELLELSRRVEASDLGAETLRQLHGAVDTMARHYPRMAPAELLPHVRRHLAYVTRLIDVRKTLEQQRRLLVAGGWLSLLAATLHIDLRDQLAADARLATAQQMAAHAEDREMLAWCLETRAWNVLTVGDYLGALELSRRAQAVAPKGGSAQIQATSQEGRAWARMRRPAETYDALRRLEQLVSQLEQPEHPEHHYQYDPGKAVSYTATTLSWVRDPAAETYAREALAQMEHAADGASRPRRAAAARLDLGLALLAAGKPDEACATALDAVASGWLVASNRWRVAEIVTAVEALGVGEAAALREAYKASA